MTFDQVITLETPPNIQKEIDISLYISEKSKWDLTEIKDRWNDANLALGSCGIAIKNAFVYSWRPTSTLLRVDDYISSDKYYDGLREAAVKSKKVTPYQFFYFQDYLENFASGPSLPFAIYPDSKIEEAAFNTAWFPYQSAQRQKEEKLNSYNEEAHEFGHILLNQGHDHSGESNIMANNSKKRELLFSDKQCKVINHLARQSLVNKFLPLFSIYYQTYGKDFYMSDWCSRNVSNFANHLNRLYDLNNYDVKSVYIISKNKGDSFYPLTARRSDIGWKFHAVLLINGYVFDLDFSKTPKVLPINQYLKTMFGDQVKNLKLQFRAALDSPGFTYKEVLRGFRSEEGDIIDAVNLLERFDEKDSL